MNVSVRSVRDRLSGLLGVLPRGIRYRATVRGVPHRVSVTGSRGKSTMVRWLHDCLEERSYDVYSKVTGIDPQSLYDGESHPIRREGETNLYENVHEVDTYDPDDAMVLENQAITPYTTRLFNTRFLDPTLLVVTNVRRDHLDTLGRTRGEVARSFADAVPDGTRVVCCEQAPGARDAFETALGGRDVEVRWVDVPEDDGEIPGAEVVAGLDAVLDELDAAPLTDTERSSYREQLTVEWTRLPGGRVFDAASANDVDSTELIRRSLAGDDPVVPFVFLRRDRPARSESFRKYLEELDGRGVVRRPVVAGAPTTTRAFARATTVDVERRRHDEDPEAVLDDLLDRDPPVLLMGNTVHPFMRRLTEVVEKRALRHRATR